MKRVLMRVMSAFAAAALTSVMVGCATTETVARTASSSGGRSLAKPKMVALEYNEFELHAYKCLVDVVKRAPREAAVGQTLEYDMLLTVQENCADVVLTDYIADGVSYVKSEPAASVEGNVLTWKFDRLQKGTAIPIKVWVKAEKEGKMTNCARLEATPYDCVATVIGKPVLTISKSGPAVARLGSEVAYNIMIRNTGTYPARDVVVIDPVPSGFMHASGAKELRFDAGDMRPGESKEYKVAFKAVERGRICNTSTARSLTIAPISADACTLIVEPMLQVSKTGTKEQFIGKTAEYDVVVSNPGDASATNVTVTDTAPEGTRIRSASGAAITGNTAVWRISELRAGQKMTYRVELTSATPGTRCNDVRASSAEGLGASDTACTVWRGVAGVLLELIDTKDPILVGEETTYVIRVTNQGTAPDSNVRIVVAFPRELTPVKATGATMGDVKGQIVTFAPVATLAPKASVEFMITARGAATGDGRVIVDLTSSTAPTAVTEVESTHVY